MVEMKQAAHGDHGDVLTPAQTLTVMALVARHGYAPQNDLGAPVDAGDRETLEGHGLVDTLKREHNVLWLSLTDAGWAWAGKHLTKAPPQAHLPLQHFLRRLDEHLEREGETLRGFVGDPPEAGKLDPELSR